MTHHIRAERNIPVEADTLWQTVNQMTDMEKWYPGLIRKSEVLDADSVQPRRNCVMQDGGVLKERVLLRDAATRTFSYAIDEHGLPAKNVVGTIRIDDLGDGTSHVSWSAQLVLDPVAVANFEPIVQEMYSNGLVSLEDYHRKVAAE